MPFSTLPKAAAIVHLDRRDARHQAALERASPAMPPIDDENARAARAIQGSPFLSPEQAAHYLGLSTRTLQEHRSAGSGPRFRRHCRHVRYHIDDLDAWSTRVAQPVRDDG